MIDGVAGNAMERTNMRHGGLGLTVGTLLLCGVVRGEDPVPVTTRSFDIAYQINDDAQPIESVALWYTRDGGETWYDFGVDEDRQSPIGFLATDEGPYGFYLLVTNATGTSSEPPRPGTTPHLRALVDFTPPVVQLHPLRQVTMLGQRTIQIRWTAIDAHFTARPLGLEYRRLPVESWRPISPDPLTNTGRYDWRPPENLSGAVAIRAIATDRVGHRAVSDSQTHEMTRMVPVGRPIVRLSGTPVSRLTSFGGRSTGRSPAHGADRVASLFTKAMVHRDRGEYRKGIARLREVVRLDPQSTDAFVEMADMLYRVDDLERALQAYELAVRQEPRMRRALRGAAMVHRRRDEHQEAAELLRTILRDDPNDAEVWINLGDLSVFQGAEVMARECYTRATVVDSAATQVIADARKRLELMSSVSRTYTTNGR